MKVVDLTHIIHGDMQVFPGMEKPIFEKRFTLKNAGFREAKFSMYSHTGTHIDSPAHMLEDGQFLDDLDINQFVGKATILDFTNIESDFIGVESFEPFEEKISNVDFIIIKTGWSKYWGEEKYFDVFPSITEEAARWLTGFNLKGIGVDAISIDNIKSSTFPVHKILLPKKIAVIENLTNLDEIDSEYFILSVLPLKNKEADGSPVRAVAIEEVL